MCYIKLSPPLEFHLILSHPSPYLSFLFSLSQLLIYLLHISFLLIFPFPIKFRLLEKNALSQGKMLCLMFNVKNLYFHFRELTNYCGFVDLGYHCPPFTVGYYNGFEWAFLVMSLGPFSQTMLGPLLSSSFYVN